MSELSQQRIDELIELAKPYYNPDLPYHHWGHAQEVMHNFDEIRTKRFGARGLRMNRHLGLIAAAFHDAGHDHQDAREYPSKEHYAAEIAMQELAPYLSADELAQIHAAILGTRYKVERTSDLTMALHYADVANMAAPYDSFLAHSRALWREDGSTDWGDFKEQSRAVITTTIDESLRLDDFCARTGIYTDPFYFPQGARANLERLASEPQPS